MVMFTVSSVIAVALPAEYLMLEGIEFGDTGSGYPVEFFVVM